jgi:ubiquinone/menaquinone biosynthesis C-methylase UbiE
MDIAAIYDQLVADHFDEDLFQIYGDARSEAWEQIRAQNRGGKLEILDLGMGTGEWLLKLQSLFPEANCHGVELSQKMMEVARKKFAATGHRVNVIHEDANHFGRHIAGDAMDLITIHFVLNYVDRPTVFSEAQRCLKEGGLFSVASSTHACFETLHGIARQFLPAEEIKAQFLIPEDLQEVERDMEKVGLRVAAKKLFRKKLVFQDFDHFYHFAMHSGWLADPVFLKHMSQDQLPFYREYGKSLFPLEDHFEAAIVLGEKA